MVTTVSVILPTFNRARSLFVSAQSVLQQSYRDLELIIIDDASQDDIGEVAAALSDPRVTYVRRDTNGGAAAARNTGLAAANGQFIAFQDSDDLWLPNKLKLQLEIMKQLPDEVGAVFGWKIVYGRDPNYHYGVGRVACAPAPAGVLRLDDDQVERFLSGNRLSLQNALFRRHCMPGSAWFDPCAKADNDWEFAARLAQNTRIYEHPEPVVLAFISSDSISTVSRKKALGLLRIAKKNRHIYANYPSVSARHKLKIARMLFKMGKYRFGRSLLLSALLEHPACGVDALGHMLSFFNRRIHLIRQRVRP